MRQNHTLAQIRQGKPTVGLWLHSQSVPLTRMIAAQGLFDWLLVDMEHAPYDLSTASLMFGAIADISGGKCTPLARVAQGSIFHIKHVLDAGAQGIIVPLVNTPEEAADVVRFSRYPPEGERGAGGSLAQLSFGTLDRYEYVREANREILVCIQIETREAVENIDAILAVPGIDLAFIGPNDLHLSLGLTPSLWSDQPAFQEAVRTVITACQRHNVPFGTLTANADGTNARLREGFTFVGLGNDVNYLLATVSAQYQLVQKK